MRKMVEGIVLTNKEGSNHQVERRVRKTTFADLADTLDTCNGSKEGGMGQSTLYGKVDTVASKCFALLRRLLSQLNMKDSDNL